MRNLYFLFVLLCSLNSCKKSNVISYNDEITDGTYCAEIEYYNPKTGTNSTYTLDVEVENGKLIKIYWSNGGWLDDSHFTPPDITDGDCSFTDDRGYEYEVILKEKGEDVNSYFFII